MLAQLGVRLVVGQQTLDLYAEVRILDPQPAAPRSIITGVLLFYRQELPLHFNLQRVVLDHLAIPQGAVLGNALLGFEIHMHHAKTLGIAH